MPNKNKRTGRANKRKINDDSFEVLRPEGGAKQTTSYLSDHEIKSNKEPPPFKSDMLFKSTAYNN
jgi:hypothetical protein